MGRPKWEQVLAPASTAWCGLSRRCVAMRCDAMRGAVVHAQARSTQTRTPGPPIERGFTSRRHDADAQRIRTGGDKFYVRIVNQSEQAPQRRARGR